MTGMQTTPASFIQFLKILQRDNVNYNFSNLQELIEWVLFLDFHLNNN
jgi:hypothetical protein